MITARSNNVTDNASIYPYRSNRMKRANLAAIIQQHDNTFRFWSMVSIKDQTRVNASNSRPIRWDKSGEEAPNIINSLPPSRVSSLEQVAYISKV